ncbi:thioesterase family protein [Mesorhizobium sp. 8]|uniref:acyl-CoA thioesterase n=1 Tax=Mesorhizobium sp. 8 TaxID=2584466 RepID=UPI00111F357B|nr:thioesterase family protein [Mesorhizobium sp. 8]QDB99476.1 acyl-CoA thioesterase [Mesorhizobium sp. 8]
MQIPSNAVSTWITPRVSETDGCGHINNTTLPVWFEAGRRAFFRAVSPALSFDNWNMAVVAMQVRFQRQIYLAHDVRIATWISKLGNKSIVVSEVALQNEAPCALGECSYVYFDYASQTAERVPDEIRQRLAPMLCETMKAIAS